MAEYQRTLTEGNSPFDGVHSVRDAVRVRELPPGVDSEYHRFQVFQFDAADVTNNYVDYRTDLLTYRYGEYLRGVWIDPSNLAADDSIYVYVGEGKQKKLWSDEKLITTSIPIEVFFEIPEKLFSWDPISGQLLSKPLRMEIRAASDTYVTWRYILWYSSRI